MEKTIFTAGYGNMEPVDFVAKLKDAGVEVVVDIRRPGCRSWCGAYRWNIGDGFGGIANLLKPKGVDYKMWGVAANCSPSLEIYEGWIKRSNSGRGTIQWFIKHMIDGVEGDAIDGKFCLLCAEGDPFEKDGVTPRCHRVYVGEALLAELGEGWSVKHL